MNILNKSRYGLYQSDVALYRIMVMRYKNLCSYCHLLIIYISLIDLRYNFGVNLNNSSYSLTLPLLFTQMEFHFKIVCIYK